MKRLNWPVLGALAFCFIAWLIAVIVIRVMLGTVVTQ